MRADCGNLKQAKGKALNITLSDNSEDEQTSGKDPKFLVLTNSFNDPAKSKSHYSESSSEEDLTELTKPCSSSL
jgi:hypothetical protein